MDPRNFQNVRHESKSKRPLDIDLPPHIYVVDLQLGFNVGALTTGIEGAIPISVACLCIPFLSFFRLPCLPSVEEDCYDLMCQDGVRPSAGHPEQNRRGV